MANEPDSIEPALLLRSARVLFPADYAVGIVAFAVSLAVYIRTLAPTVYGEDSGELISAAFTLGIPHPTGYPLWCILAKLFIVLVPSGDVAWRVNLMSAVFGAGAVMLTALILCVLVRNRVAALAGALSLAFSLEFWEQNVIAEVYSLNAFVTALCILLLIVWGRTRENRVLYATGLLFGVGLANHQVLLLAAPAFAVYVLYVSGLRWGAWTMHLITMLLAFAGLAVYLYLPIRSAANPAMDWGDPQTLHNFWDVVTRAQYRFIITDGPRSWGRFFREFYVFGGIYLEQFTAGIGLFALLGVFVLWTLRERAVCVMLVIVWVVNVIGSILVPNYGDDRMSIWLNTTYWIPAYLVTAVFVGVGIAGICAAMQRVVVRGVVALILCVTAVAAPFIANFTHNDKSQYYLAADYARNILTTLAPGAIYFGDSDLSLFTVMYCQIVEGLRKDVMIANPYGYPIEPVYRGMDPAVKATFAKIPTEADEQVIFDWLVKHSGRPVYTSALRRGDGIQSRNDGLLYRYAPVGETMTMDAPWSRYAWRTLDESAFGDDWSAEVILSEYYFARGRAEFDRGERARGINSIERAAFIARANKDELNNIGCALADYGLYEDAARFFADAVALDRTFIMARLNLGRAYMKRGEFAKAKDVFDAVAKEFPTNEDAMKLSVYCNSKLK